MVKPIYRPLSAIVNTDEIFREFLDNLKVKDYKRVMNEIAEKCNVTRATVEHWKSGRARIKPVHMHVINEIAGEKIFKAEMRDDIF